MTEARKRILILARDPMMGGAAASLHRLAGALPAAFEPHFLTIGRRRSEHGPLATLGRMVHDARALAHLLRRQSFDLVQLNPSLGWKSLLREALHAFTARQVAPALPQLVFVRGWSWPVAGRMQQLRWPLVLFRWLLGPPRHMVVLGQAFADWLVAHGWPRTHVHLSTTNFNDRQLTIEQALAAPLDQRRSILFLGRLIAPKGAGIAIDAFRRLRADNPDLTMTVAGDGPERIRLMTLHADLVRAGVLRFPGDIAGQAKTEALLSALLFVLPTRHDEGLPNALLEAMAAGTIPVVTAVGGIADIVEADRNAIVIDEATVDGVERALRHALARRDVFAAEFGTRVRAAHARFAASQVGLHMAAIYQAVMTDAAAG